MSPSRHALKHSQTGSSSASLLFEAKLKAFFTTSFVPTQTDRKVSESSSSHTEEEEATPAVFLYTSAGERTCQVMCL